MSLGTKIKEALRGPDYSEPPQDDITQRPPGAFPADDIPSSQNAGAADLGHSGSQRNKLHKPDDPRGWGGGGSESNNPGHRYTDSGVGLMEHNDPAKLPSQDPAVESGRQMPEPIASQPHEDKSAGARAFGLGSSSANEFDRTGRPEAGPGTGSARTEGISGEPAALAGYGTEGPKGDDNINQTREPGSHPYWGDIPRGVGVYNTVTGHGSAEDELHHHDGQHAAVTDKGTAGGPAASGAETSDLTKPEAADLAPVSREQPGEIHDGKKTGHGEALPAAGVGAGAAGLAAYEASKRHERNTAQDQKPLEGDKTSPESAEHDEKKGNKLTALFHGSHKDDKSEPKPRDEPVIAAEHRHEKHDKDKHHKEEKDSKLAGILHRDHKDEKQQPHHQKPEDEAKPRRSEDKYEEHLDEAKAAALAAYAAQGAGTDDKHHHEKAKHEKDRAAEPDSPKEKKESKLHALFHRSHKDKDSKHEHEEKKHDDRKEPVVVPITQERVPRHDQDRQHRHQHQPTDTAAAPAQPAQDRDSHWKEGAAAAGAGGAAGYMATKAADHHREQAVPTEPTRQPATDFSQPRAAEPHQDLSTLSGSTGTGPAAFPATHEPRAAETGGAPQHTHHDGSKAALAGAGVAGAGAAAYYGQKHHHNNDAQPESVGPTPPPKDMPAPYSSQPPPYAGGVGAAPFASSATPVTKADEPKATTATAPAIPSTGGSGTQGGTTETRYNMLPSGTVSGVKVADSSAAQQPQAANDTFLSNDARPTQKTAAPAPVPAPAPIATEQRATKEEAAPPPAAAAAAPIPTQAPDSSRVIHKCHNCGEDNDITHYFNK